MMNTINEKTCKTVRLSYSIALSAMTVIYAALIFWQLYLICSTGGVHPYTAERVAAGLSRISPAFWLWVVMIAGGFIVWEVFPVAEKQGAYKDARYTLYRLKKHMPKKFEGELAESYSAFMREERKVKILWAVVAAVGAACAIYTIVYLAKPSSFASEDVTDDVVSMVKYVMPFVGAAFVIALGVALCEGIIANRQLPVARKLAAVRRTEENTAYVPPNKFFAVLHTAGGKVSYVTSNKYFTLGVRIAIACVGVAFVIAGIVNGNAGRVLIKAVNICLECVGIG